MEAASISIAGDPMEDRAFEGLFLLPFGESFDEEIGAFAFHEEGDAFACKFAHAMFKEVEGDGGPIFWVDAADEIEEAFIILYWKFFC